MAMKILLVADHSAYGERGVEKITAQSWPLGTTARVLVVVRNIAPPAATLWHDARGSLEWAKLRLRYCAIQRAESLAEALRAGGISAGVVVRDSKLGSVTLDEIKEWQPDKLVVGLHSFTGIKRRLLEFILRSWLRKRKEDTEQDNRRAA
jgi:nucleotide-binding universal stress UspA family protein